MIIDNQVETNMSNTNPSSSSEEMLMSIKNLFTPKYLLLLKEILHIDLTPDILEQIKVVLISIGAGNGSRCDKEDDSSPYNSHFYAAVIVVFSHLVDDIFDKYPNHIEFRGEVEKLATDFLEKSDFSNCDEVFSKMLTLVDDNSSENYKTVDILRFLKGYLTQEQINVMDLSMIKMILAGLAQTSFEAKANDPEYQQNTFVTFYKIIIAKNLGDSDLARTIKKENSSNPEHDYVFPNEVWISTASSLQEMFASVEEDIDIREIELWNGLLGPLVFLNNVSEEKVDFVKFLDRDAKLYDYERFINTNWIELKKLLLKDKETGKLNKLKVIQFVLGHLLLVKGSGAHSYKNFPEDLQDLEKIYNEIFTEILGIGLISNKDLQTYQMLIK